MSLNLLDVLKSQMSGSVISQAASLLGESEQGTQSAMGAILPALLGSTIKQASTTQGAAGLMDLLKTGGHDGGILSNIGGLLGGGSATNGLMSAGGGILKSLLGDKVGGLAELVASFAGIKSGSASSLLSMAAPLLMGTIGKQVMGSGMGVSGLANLLMGQSEHVKAAMPAGLSAGLGSLLGLGDLGDFKGAASAATNFASNTGGHARAAVNEVVEETSGGMGWMPWLLGLLLAAGLGWFAMKGCNKTEVVEETTAAVDTTAAVISSVIEKVLPGGIKISFDKGTVEDQLVSFIESADTIDKKKWFTFDGLNFDTGKSTLQAGSEAKLDNIAAIMKAFEKVSIKVGGYTDNVGSEKSNMKLSAARAETVMAQIVSRGIAADRLKSEGYGPQHPVADNATEEGRAQNRRIDVNVTSK